MNELRFFNPYAEIRHTENRLPHWQQAGAVYFITFRLADAIPTRLREEWEEQREIWLQLHPPPWTPETENAYHRRFSRAIEGWLDAGHGSCVLRRPDCSAVVDEAFCYFTGHRYALISSVVMPNHVHALFVQHSDWPLEKLTLSWKTFTARRINKLVGRSGSLWQRDYFDRLVRDQKHFANCVRYIRKNPHKARVAKGEYTLYESDLAKQIE